METDVRWSSALREEIMDVPVNFRVNLLEQDLALRDLMELQVGDIIPIKMPEHATMFVEELPTFRVKMGRSGEKLAVQVSEKIRRPDVVKTDLAFLGKDIIAELDNDEDEDEETVE
jgi:flagellar motor switch protein FliM